MDGNTSIIISSSGEKEDDSDSTDYEPDQKKQKLDEDKEEGESNNTSIISNGLDAAMTNNRQRDTIEQEDVINNTSTATNIINVSSDADPKPEDTVVVPLPQQLFQNLSSLSSVRRSGRRRRSLPTQLGRMGRFRLTNAQSFRRRRRQRQNGNVAGEDSVSNISSITSSSTSSSSFIHDDINPMEIPSDEVLSPPIIRHNRQRRNAIFERRDPPPYALLLDQDDHVFLDQLEVASMSDENPIEDENSTSGADDQRPKPPLLCNESAECVVEETDNNFADVETVRTDVESDDDIPPNSPKTNELLSSDSELSEKDKWVCSQCKSKSLPHFRYCLKCFQMRRSWLPQRPLSRRLKKRKKAQKKSNSLNNSRTTRSSCQSCASDGEDVVDGAVKPETANPVSAASVTEPEAHAASSSSNSNTIQRHSPHGPNVNLNQAFLVDEESPGEVRISAASSSGNLTPLDLFTPPQGRVPTTNVQNLPPGNSSSQAMNAPFLQSQSGESSQKSTSSSGGSGSQWSQSQSSSSQSQGFSQNSHGSSATFSESPLGTQESKTETKDVNYNLRTLCAICCAREKDAAFVHNKIAHHFCCYTCADRILKQTGKCPICRERVFRVVKIISV